MSILDKLKRKPEDDEDVAKWLMKQSLEEVTDYLAYKLTETEKPVITMTIMYLDVKFTISCERANVNEIAEAIREKIEKGI